MNFLWMYKLHHIPSKLHHQSSSTFPCSSRQFRINIPCLQRQISRILNICQRLRHLIKFDLEKVRHGVKVLVVIIIMYMQCPESVPKYANHPWNIFTDQCNMADIQTSHNPFTTDAVNVVAEFFRAGAGTVYVFLGVFIVLIHIFSSNYNLILFTVRNQALIKIDIPFSEQLCILGIRKALNRMHDDNFSTQNRSTFDSTVNLRQKSTVKFRLTCA